MNQESQSKVLRLLVGLLSATQRGQLTWQQTDSPNRFAAVLGSGSVVVSANELWVQDSDGNTIEHNNAILQDFVGELPGADDQTRSVSFGQLMGLVNEAARRQALNVDQTLDALLADLGS